MKVTKKMSKLQNLLVDRVIAELKQKQDELINIVGECGLELGVPTTAQFQVEEVISKREFTFESED